MSLGLYAKIVANNLQADVKTLNGVLIFVETANETEPITIKALKELKQDLKDQESLIEKL